MENIILFDVLSYCVMFMCSDSLWTTARCRQWEGILRAVEGRILKEPHFLIPEWQHVTNIHTDVQCLQNKGIFDWLSCTAEPKVCDITQSYVNISRVSVSITATETQQFDLRKDRLLELHKIIVNYLKRKENSMRIKIHISPKCWYNGRSCS